jgi:5-methyltetrahydrofolate--homocysteine methyltransferase
LVAGYKTQLSGLIDGGCDIIMVETIFDTLNAKAALMAIDVYYDEHPEKPRAPLIVSDTFVHHSD